MVELADLRQRHGLGQLAVTPAALADAGAAELAAWFAAREVSPLEVARAVVARVEAWEPALHALYAFDAERLLAQARASEARWLKNAPLSPLDGVPVTIKENVATRDIPVPLGSAATELVPAVADAPPAARLREAGCVLLAKTTMPDWGMLSSGLSSFHALARNPWDLSKSPGGSSAGAAAAAAAGYGPLHLGTDIGGSIRLPAGWCGVVGFKPSHGRVPIHPPYAGRAAGPITRTVDDAARMMAVLAQPDDRDTMSLPAQPLDWLAPDPDHARGLRIGLWLDAGWGLPVQAETRTAVEACARALEQGGAAVEPVAPFCTREMADGIDRFWRMRSWLDLQALPDERRTKVLPYIRDWLAPAAGYTGAQVFHGYGQMAQLREAAVTASRGFDALLSPVSPVPAFPADWASPLNDPQRPFDHIAFTLPFNMSEQPAIAVPWGFTAAGLPLGVQVAGRRHDDVGVLRLARLVERLRAPLRRWPGAPGITR